MIELKKRIKGLAGKSAKNVAIMTYHGFAMRITGSSFLAADSDKFKSFENTQSFDEIIKDATLILRGEKEIAGLEDDEARDILLSQYKYIFVDEYQDIDNEQYKFLSSITGRLENNSESKISIMAVGDDDQSIYGFRDANIKYIKQYEEDYNAKTFYMVENYRSTHSIIEASNHLISFNKERMKTDNPVKINNRRKENQQPPDKISKEMLVQLINVENIESMGVSLANEIEKIKAENPDMSYDDFAVVSRVGISKAPLVCARLALAKKEIPFCYSIKRDSGFSIIRVREIQIFIDFLEKNKEKSIIPNELKRETLSLYQKKSTWVNHVEEILDAWCMINPEIEISVLKALNFVFEVLLEERRDTKTGKGVYLGTVHSVKGMEFKYVFILDGGWQNKISDFEKEEERRLYYVGMTRAEKKLTLYSLKSEFNPHTTLLNNCPYVIEKQAGKNLKINGYSENLTVSIIGMRDIIISYPGFSDDKSAIHRNIKNLSCGDTVELTQNNNGIYIYGFGNRVAKLSNTGTNFWSDKVDKIVKAKILAIVKRKKDDDEESTMQNIKTDFWELPIVEVLHRID